jgi:hypothetical protein
VFPAPVPNESSAAAHTVQLFFDLITAPCDQCHDYYFFGTYGSSIGSELPMHQSHGRNRSRHDKSGMAEPDGSDSNPQGFLHRL